MQNRYKLLALPLAAMLSLPVLAQDTTSNQTSAQPQSQTQTQPASQTPAETKDQTASANQSDTGHQPLQLEQKEGFWGHLNPFARKKYVRRQMSPVVGRVNELDELTNTNSKNIKDVDARSSEGIRLATAKATEADTHALDAANRANQANETAAQANTRLEKVSNVVSNIDQYQRMQDTEIRFRPGQLALSDKAKAALDELAVPLKSQKGYVVEVQGFSSTKGSAGIQNSQKMADAVVRYLVMQHEVPVYRIYTLGMGNAQMKTTAQSNETPAQQKRRMRGGVVEISLLRNNLADLESASGAQNAAPNGAQSNDSTTPSTPANTQQNNNQSMQQQSRPVSPDTTQLPQSDKQSAPKSKDTAPVAPPK
ncbi:MAG: outer membrane protein OmpA/MotB family [Acidobacteriales bacterium]|nr:outer membrane protein OmpA/MotB family [Terriglobales bacterium]